MPRSAWRSSLVSSCRRAKECLPVSQRSKGFDPGDGKLRIPNLTRGRRELRRVMPRPCDFLRRDLPKCSVIRPSATANAGAVAAATGLVNSGLFAGQPPAFFNAVVALAQAADDA